MGYPVRPSGYVGWGSTGMTNVTEPTDAKKAVGWAINEAPPSAYFNWIQKSQDESLAYLRWKDSLQPVIVDDFIKGANSQTGLAEFWYLFQTGGQQWVITETNLDVGGSRDGTIGARECQLAATGYAELLADVGYPGRRDFFMEHIARFRSRPQASNYCFELGLMYSHAGVSGHNTQLGWVATGITGRLSFCWVPSGKSPTLYDLGSVPSNASGYHKFTVEGRSPTMAFYIDDALAGAVAMVPVGAQGSDAAIMFGQRIGGQSTAARFVVDAVTLRYGKNPT
jgi:hypothetical protein